VSTLTTKLHGISAEIFQTGTRTRSTTPRKRPSSIVKNVNITLLDGNHPWRVWSYQESPIQKETTISTLAQHLSQRNRKAKISGISYTVWNEIEACQAAQDLLEMKDLQPVLVVLWQLPKPTLDQLPLQRSQWARTSEILCMELSATVVSPGHLAFQELKASAQERVVLCRHQTIILDLERWERSQVQVPLVFTRLAIPLDPGLILGPLLQTSQVFLALTKPALVSEQGA